MKYIYEFTNKRKLTKAEFLRWFQKKFLYVIRKFEMIKREDVVGYCKSDHFRGVVLQDLLEMFAEKSSIELVKLPKKSFEGYRDTIKKNKLTKFAIPSNLDTEADAIIHEIIKSKLKKHSPVEGKVIKPLYLFLDKEVLLYAKLKGLKFKKVKQKKDKISSFVEELEKKHPEIKNSIVSSYLELFC